MTSTTRLRFLAVCRTGPDRVRGWKSSLNALVLTIVALILSTSPNRAAGQESVLGVWEIVDDDIVTVMSFRDDGIMVQNEFFDGELECVFVFPYEVDGDQLTLGRGLTWEVDPETGDLVPVEDLDELSL